MNTEIPTSSHPLIEAANGLSTDPVLRAQARTDAATADAAVVAFAATDDPGARAAAVAAFGQAVTYWITHALIGPVPGWVAAQRQRLGLAPTTRPLPVPRGLSKRFGNPL